jgi:Domain of unknown function (DUF4375)
MGSCCHPALTEPHTTEVIGCNAHDMPDDDAENADDADETDETDDDTDGEAAEQGDDDGPSEEDVRAALRALRAGDEASLGDVLTLVVASPDYAIPLVPQEALDAVYAKYAMDRDVANGGMDQVAWNHGHELARTYAKAFRAVGAIENADLLDRLAAALESYYAEHGSDAIGADPVKHFHAYRRSVDGPSFRIPEPSDELAEPLLEFVLERASALPDSDGELPRKPQ